MNAPMDSKRAEMTRTLEKMRQTHSAKVEAVKLMEQEMEAQAEQTARDLLATNEARHKAEDRLRAEECERAECEARERKIAKIEESKRVRERAVQKEALQSLQESARLEEKLAEERLRAEECERAEYESLKKSLRKSRK